MFTASMFFREEEQKLAVCMLCVDVDKWLLSAEVMFTMSHNLFALTSRQTDDLKREADPLWI